MYKPSQVLLTAAGVLTVLASVVPLSVAETRDTRSDREIVRLASRYTEFAGSDANARALVAGLRNDSTIELSPKSPGQAAATFDPATGKLGFGNIAIALSLARKELADAGVSQPSPAQIQAALNGGTADGKTYPGILALRSKGMGWGEIAKSLGFRLGDLVSASHTERTRTGVERPEKAEKADRPDKPERTARADRVDRPQRPAH